MKTLTLIAAIFSLAWAFASPLQAKRRTEAVLDKVVEDIGADPAKDENVVRETRFVYLKEPRKSDNDRHERGMHLGGPRFGLTYVDGPTSKRSRDSLKQMRGEEVDVKPWLGQFGWHTEYRFFRTDGGTTALLEFIPLIGGMNQSLVLPSASLLFGLRTVSGIEFGAGPNANLDGASYIVAAGYSFDLGGLIIPLNAAVGFGQDRSSYTLSTGFNL